MRIQRLTSETIVDIAELRKQIKLIQENGYAVSRGERVEGAYSVSAPLFDFRNQVVGAISISGPTNRFSDDKIVEYSGLLVKATEQISMALGKV
jgi:DNA-binding IclR family transcriptional regulator